MNDKSITDLLDDRDYTRKKFRLKDGRNLSYAECGNIHSGYPVIVQFGLMGSSLIVVTSHYKALIRNLRLIAVDYPGIGESTAVPEKERTLINWSHDMQEFVDGKLGSNAEFGMLGHSMGAPHVLAICSNNALRSRISCITFVAPWLGDLLQNEEKEENRYEPPWYVNAVRNSPTFLQDHVITQAVTPLLASNTLILGLTSSVVGMYDSERSSKLNTVKHILSYGTHQGSDGVRQTMKMALSTDLFTDEVLYNLFHCENNESSTAASATTKKKRRDLDDDLTANTASMKSFLSADMDKHSEASSATADTDDSDDNLEDTLSSVHSMVSSIITAVQHQTKGMENIPITIFHGTNDTMIPLDVSKKLVYFFKQKFHCKSVELYAVEDADHDTVLTTQTNLRRVLQTIAMKTNANNSYWQ